MFKKIAVTSLFMIFASTSQAKEESSIKTKTDACYTYSEIAYNAVILKERGFSKEYIIKKIKEVAPNDSSTTQLVELVYKTVPAGTNPKDIQKITYDVCME